jgi:methyl-accepting chemotaxis protein
VAGRSLTITYLADADKVLAAQKQIDAGHSTLDSSTKKTGGVFSSTFGSVMPLAAAAAGAAVLKFGADSINAFKESEAAMAQTNAVLKSTGGVANVTADDVLKLAQKLRDVSGADDEAIQASENLLLTFTQIRNEAGKGNDVFNQTAAAVLDMATSMNNGAIPSMEDLNSKTILVGKAMNDPIKGLTALTRVGVNFKDGQREQIAAMVAAGDTMGAQKIILAELTKEFGGSAKAAGDTFAGAQAKAAQKIEDLQEKIGGILLPVLTDLADTFADILTKAGPLIELIGHAFAAAVELASENLKQMVGPLEYLVDLIPQTSKETDEGGASFFEYGKAIANLGNPITTFTNLRAKQSDAGDILTLSLGEEKDALEELPSTMKGVESSERGLFEQQRRGAEATEEWDSATKQLSESMRDQRLAALALADSFLGIIDSAHTLADDQRELNQLQKHGKEGTTEYDDAVLQVIEDQLALTDTILSYGKEVADSTGNTKDAEKAIRDAANAANLNKREVNDLISEIHAYINEVNRIPSDVYTQVHVSGQSAVHQQFQHGGVVERTGLAMVHKGEVFSGVNNEMGFGGPTLNVSIGTVVGPGGIEEVADILLRELQKHGIRNVTAGIP